MKKLLIVALLIISLFSCGSIKTTTFIGYRIIDLSREYQDEFVFDKIESKSLYHLIDNNGKNETTKTTISSIIKNSQTIFLSIGLFDLMKNVKLDNGSLSFEFKPSIIELFELNLVNIIDCIYSYQKKVKINIFSLYNPYVEDNTFFYKDYLTGVARFNEVIENVCYENKCNYLDITFISKNLISYNRLNNEAINIIEELVHCYE